MVGKTLLKWNRACEAAWGKIGSEPDVVEVLESEETRQEWAEILKHGDQVMRPLVARVINSKAGLAAWTMASK